MNRIIKVGLMSLAMAAVVPAFADEELEVVDEGADGWTPITFGIASPVQLPWGHCKWDVYGLDIGLLYSGQQKAYGLEIAGVAAYNKGNAGGLKVSGLLNWSKQDFYGVRATLGGNICNEVAYGFQAGAFGYGKDFWGLDVEFLGAWNQNVWGWQIGGLANIVRQQSYGWELAIGCNISDIAYGCQLSGLFNMANELHGCQIGLVNYADDCEWGFQIGLVNIIMSNKLKVLPILNAYF